MASAGRAGQALSPGTQRLFFALWPEDGVRAALAHTARRMHGVFHGSRTRDQSLHLTLVFLGDVDVEHLSLLLDPPDDICVPAFELALDEWGGWSRNKIGWAAPSQVPQPLRELVANLEAWLRTAEFAIERRAFLPHVTLVRKAQATRMPEPMKPITWMVRDFHLIHSQAGPGGSRYEAIGSWPLRA
ncbi:MAG TPA: RNA 2',3'-cyclic phosphodiesterase [Burkholderiales bacterium]|nr:RNA 2',3'-cyclic phosphodiesterase [Burkholderiales bacterium]